jgi:hypothetical protein
MTAQKLCTFAFYLSSISDGDQMTKRPRTEQAARPLEVEALLSPIY